MHSDRFVIPGKMNKALRRPGMLPFLVMACLAAPIVIADADGQRWEDDDNSYDQARRALSRGDVLPVEEVIKQLKTHIPGQVLEIEFEREHARWVYEFKMIDESGRRLEVYLDAKTAELISVEGQ